MQSDFATNINVRMSPMNMIINSHSSLHNFRDGIGKTNQEAKSSTPLWDLQTFQKFIADTVAGLNKLAYSLTVPGSTRLALLFEKVSKSKNYYEEIKW
jgi:hypothetical protein